MKNSALVIIKPEGLYRGIVGDVLNKFEETGLEIIAMRLVEVSRPQAEEHYKQLQGQPFFQGVIKHLMGKYHDGAKAVVLVYHGKDAIKKCRKMAGATNPQEADPNSIRGSLGRVTKEGLYENVVHVSSDIEEAKREIRLWLSPEDIYANILPTKKVKQNGVVKRVWK
jgi:nucleoside-diphosphate kinase